MKLRAAIPLGIYTFLTVYATRHLVSGLEIDGIAGALIAVAVAALAAFVPAYWYAQKASRPVRRILYWAGGLYLAWFMWGVVASLIVDTVRIVAWLTGDWLPADALRRPVTLGVLGIFGVATAYGLRAALRTPAPRRIEIPVANLPDHLDGISIAHLTDLHIGPVHGAARMARVVSATNAAKPDIIVLTGDQADGDAEEFHDGVGPLGDLRAPLGVYSINGNHDHYGGANGIGLRLTELGIVHLVNSWEEVAPRFVIAGLDDPARVRVGGFDGYAAALAGIPAEATVVLLAHQPSVLEWAARHGVTLVLSGHTHGGQIWPWGWIVRRFYRHVAGRYRHGRTHLSVSRGIGTWGPPIRLGAPVELPVYVLRQAASRAIPASDVRAYVRESRT